MRRKTEHSEMPEQEKIKKTESRESLLPLSLSPPNFNSGMSPPSPHPLFFFPSIYSKVIAKLFYYIISLKKYDFFFVYVCECVHHHRISDDPMPSFEGPLAVNDVLKRGKKVLENELYGPEALVLDNEGVVNTALNCLFW